MNGNLLALVNAANARADKEREAEEEQAIATAAQERASAAAAAAASQSITNHPAPGSYENPLRDVRGLSAERIDQGVDYGGYGPIYAVGDGTVISTYNGGWPGGTFISYKLSDGPAQGLVVYAAEDIDPSVQVGQSVTADTVIGQMYEGPEGIETGWADGSGDGTTMAADAGQYEGWNSTAFGVNFDQLLTSLGAPGGQAQSSGYGNVPSGWPSW